MAVEITRQDLTAAALRREAARRMLAIALVLDGHSREDAAESCGMDRQTLRDRAHRQNAERLAGLADRRATGRRPRLSAAQEAEVVRWAEDGPDLERDGVVRRRRGDLRARIGRRFGVRFHPRTVGKPLARLRFRRLLVWPQPPQSDPAAQEAFRGASPSGRRPSSPRPPGASRPKSGSATVGSMLPTEWASRAR